MSLKRIGRWTIVSFPLTATYPLKHSRINAAEKGTEPEAFTVIAEPADQWSGGAAMFQASLIL